MKWYEGPIHEAISTAKRTSKIFLVFIDGKDEISETMNNTYNNSVITEAVEQNCVAIKLSSDSEQFKQFSQIYPVLLIPSSFFIGNEGIPLEVIAGNFTVDEFVKKVKDTIQVHKAGKAQTANPAPLSSVSSVNSDSTLSGSNLEMQVPEGDDLGVSLDTKVERAKQLLEERRLQKIREDQEEAKKKELEYRRVGKEIQTAREKQQAREMAEWAQQRKKEKDDDKIARERVKAQIAQDRADRAAKFQSSNTETPRSDNSNIQQSEIRQRPSNSDRTRIQFRLPNAVTRTQEFASSALLQEVFNFIEQSIQPGFTNFSLATTFSRRQFTRQDSSTTLYDLELVPSAVLLIIPTGGSVTSVSSNFNVWPLLASLFSPFLFVWNLVLSMFRGGGPPLPIPPSATPARPPVRRTANPKPPGENNKSDSSSASGGSSGPTSNKNSGAYKRDGNIHRLANDSMDDDDENNTWNGNSTQQL